MKTRSLLLATAFVLSVLATALLLNLLSSSQWRALAQGGTGVIRVAKTGADAPGCGSSAAPCGSVQYAVDQAEEGHEILVAGGV